jgi:zinc and cadmium transporter
VAWLVSGFLVMFLLQRFLPFHHHDVAEGELAPGPEHEHADSEHAIPARPLDWIGVTIGLSLHSVFDGLALAAAVTAVAHSHGGVLGLGTALAVILHKPFGAMAITTLMAASRAPRRSVWLINVGFAMVTPLGALLFFLGAAPLAQTHPAWLGAALAFCAGTFLCIACADLLPELQFHSHDRLKLSLALLLGVATAILIVFFGHGNHTTEQPSEHVDTFPRQAWPQTVRGQSPATAASASSTLPVHRAGHSAWASHFFPNKAVARF